MFETEIMRNVALLDAGLNEEEILVVEMAIDYYEEKENEVMEKNYVELMLQEVEAELEKAENQTNNFFRWLLDDCEKYTGVKTSDSIKACKELLKVGKDYFDILIMYNSSSEKVAVLRQAKQQLLEYNKF